MIVHEAVIIPPPYRAEDCKGPKEKQEVLNRVRKVLEGERRKIKEKEERDRRAAAAAAPTATAPAVPVSLMAGSGGAGGAARKGG